MYIYICTHTYLCIFFIIECYCGKSKRDVICQSNISLTYSCENTCEKLLDCGNHKCKKTCHPNSCESCTLTPEKITTCCCGRTPLSDERKTCLDPIPTCEEICSKVLNCGQPSKYFINAIISLYILSKMHNDNSYSLFLLKVIHIHVR